MISLQGSGQKCPDPPRLTLSAGIGSTCLTTPVDVGGNTFGGSATRVTITDNGFGSVTPAVATVSPFTFTYSPEPGDIGKDVTITVVTNNPLGNKCKAVRATVVLKINPDPSAPAIGTITQATCQGEGGSVILNGLPANGTWIINPGSVTGSGTSTNIYGLIAGTYNYTVTDAIGCTSAASENFVINTSQGAPASPIIGSITQPTCAISTGSVALSGLPATGTWSVNLIPGGIIGTGTGTTTIISTIAGGTYTFTVTNSSGCVSPASPVVVINGQAATPPAPLPGSVTAPSCTSATGSVILNGLPDSGTWTLNRYPGTITSTGTGVSTTVTGLTAGLYNFTIQNSGGCTSMISSNVTIPVPPPSADIPIVGTVTQPTQEKLTGSAILNGLPSAGSWIITQLPEGVQTTGTGTSFTVTGLTVGSHTFKLTNSSGCTSDPSDNVVILKPVEILLLITNPPVACSTTPIDLTAADITKGSTPGLIFTYWTNPEATTQYLTPASATAGTYYIKGTTISGIYDIKPVIVTTSLKSLADAGPDQSLDYQFSTTLDAELGANETGVWSVTKGSGLFNEVTNPKTVVTNLSVGNNIMTWKVSNGVCPPDSDQVAITIRDIKIPTLITPNGDSRNEYFEIMDIGSLGKSELIVFDRRGVEVFKNSNYDNRWNGIDYNQRPLPDDTYFYILKSEKGKAITGYIVVKR